MGSWGTGRTPPPLCSPAALSPTSPDAQRTRPDSAPGSWGQFEEPASAAPTPPRNCSLVVENPISLLHGATQASGVTSPQDSGAGAPRSETARRDVRTRLAAAASLCLAQDRATRTWSSGPRGLGCRPVSPGASGRGLSLVMCWPPARAPRDGGAGGPALDSPAVPRAGARRLGAPQRSPSLDAWAAVAQDHCCVSAP